MPSNPLSQYPGYALRRASTASTGELTSRLAPMGLRITEANLLVVIGENPGITQSQLGRLLSMASANVAPVIGKLDRKGLLKRHRVDGRSQGIQLTEAGTRLAVQAYSTIKTHEEAMLAHISPDLRKSLVESLNQMWAENE